MSQFAKKLRTILEKAGKCDAEGASTLLAEAQESGRPLTEVVVKKGVCTDGELMALICRAANTPPISLAKIRPNPDVLDAVPIDVAKDYRIFPIDRIGNIITLAVANPFDVLKLDDIRIITGCQLRPVVATEEDIEAIIEKAYQGDAESVDDLLDSFDGDDVELRSDASEDEDGMDLSAISDEASPVVKMVNKIVADACNSGVSDIHFEPFEKKFIVRYRKDGRLIEAMQLPKRMQNNITSRIKIMSKLDIAEKFRPQDGKFQMRLGNKAIDFRVSILPVVWGEKDRLSYSRQLQPGPRYHVVGLRGAEHGGLHVGRRAARMG